jgi:hypothetical protein
MYDESYLAPETGIYLAPYPAKVTKTYTMRKLFLLFLLIPFFSLSQDQTVKGLQNDSQKNIKKDPNDTTVKLWKTGGMYGINLSQGTLNNWAAGGDEFSLSVNSILSVLSLLSIKRTSIAGTTHSILILGMSVRAAWAAAKMMTALIFFPSTAMP